MSASFLKVFDVAEQMNNSWLIGYDMGEQAQKKLKAAIDDAGANVVWKIEFGRSIGVDYCFVETCLAPILTDYGKSLPDNTILVVPCRNGSDRENLLRGLGWQRGDANVYTEQEALNLIIQRKRFCVRVKAPKEENPNDLDYVATSEQNLLQAVRLIESKGEATVDDVKKGLQWDTSNAVHALEELKRRRQIFSLPVTQKSSGEDEHYLSITRILTEKKV